MHSHHSGQADSPLAERRANYKTGCGHCAKPDGGIEMDPRVTELEIRLKSIGREMEEIRGDVKSIKHRLAYTAGGAAVVIGLWGWIANSRFDQVVAMLAQ